MNGVFSAFLRPRHAAAGGALLHPVMLLSLVVLVVNDHVIKHCWPGVLSGKLSDFAVMVLLPLFLHGLVELAYQRLSRPLGAAASARWLLGSLVASALIFGLPEVWQPAELTYRYGAAALRYPFQLFWAMLHGRASLRFVPVRATADITDLLALPMALLAWRAGRVRAPAAQASAVSHST
jgi:hypothetical protein